MGTEENIQVVKAAYAAFGRGDIQALLGMLTEDVEWRFPGEGLPLSGVYRGHDGVARFFKNLDQDSQMVGFEPREFLTSGGRVVALGWYRGKIKATGQTFESEWAMAFTVRDGKIARFQEYVDTQVLAAAHVPAAKAAT